MKHNYYLNKFHTFVQHFYPPPVRSINSKYYFAGLSISQIMLTYLSNSTSFQSGVSEFLHEIPLKLLVEGNITSFTFSLFNLNYTSSVALDLSRSQIF